MPRNLGIFLGWIHWKLITYTRRSTSTSKYHSLRIFCWPTFYRAFQMYFSSFPSVCNFEYEDLAIFDAFAKLRKATISFVMSVQTSVRPIDCLSVGQHGTSHCKCFTTTVAVPHYTMCVLHCDSCCSTLHTVSASLRQLLFHSTQCVCFTATVAVPLFTL